MQYMNKIIQKNMNKNTHEYYMKEALKEAKKAYNKKEVPIGCVIVHNNQIIARAHNLRKKNNDVFAHAETLAIKKACKKLGSWILEDCTLYVTVEPCLMCAGTILQSRIKKIVYGTIEPKFGAVESLMKVFETKSFNHQVEVLGDIMKEESALLMKEFFKELRKNK